MIKEINITNFRKIRNLKINFKNENLLITGNNAQGKTSIAEALFFCAFFHTPRTTKKKEFISFDQTYSLIDMKLTNNELRLMVTPDRVKALVNQNEITSLSEAIGIFDCVYLSQDSIHLVEGSGQKRRQFLDRNLSKIDESYLYLMQKYKKIIKQKRLLLKAKTIDVNYLEIINEQLYKLDNQITNKRVTYLKQLKPLINNFINWLTNEKEEIEIKYNQKEVPSPKINEKEKILQSPLYGNHLDDFIIKINGKDLKTYGSQGQKRSIAIALNIVHLNIMYQKIGKYPLVILDDLLADLDFNRQEKLYSLIVSKTPCVIITPNLKNISNQIQNQKNLKLIQIKDGKII